MRTRAFRMAAVLLGVLGVPSLVWQVRRAWPPDQSGLSFFGVQAAVLYAFLSFGLGIGPLAPARPLNRPEPSEGGDSADA